ncbi:MAG: hypothetical protein N3G22_03580 [Candidatus Micrarchaeota archaeon]|nr:hypothetical protein [Candidatus Micrarchaeota archaeon]
MKFNTNVQKIGSAPYPEQSRSDPKNGLTYMLDKLLSPTKNTNTLFRHRTPLTSLLRYDQTSKYVSDLLLDCRYVKIGGITKKTSAFVDYVLSACNQDLLNDKTFAQFLKGLARVYCSSGGETAKNKEGIAIALIEHAKAEYELFNGWLPDSIIKKNGWTRTVFELYEILQQAQSVFGAEESTRELIRTAANLVWNKNYPSIQSAMDSIL